MATKANITIDQGTTFSTDIVLTDENGDPINLSAYTATGQLRQWYGSLNATSFSISSNSTSGTLTLGLSSANTINLTPGRYVFDVKVTDAANTTTRIVEGIATVTPAVTS